MRLPARSSCPVAPVAPVASARRTARAVALAVAACASALACGPSFQVVYEGDQKFEHCYALDDNPNAPMVEKGACWREWMKGYTYGQTRDRVEYAAMRARALTRAPSLPTDEALMEAAPGESTIPGVAAPAPTSAFAPPPKTMNDQGVRPPSPTPSVVFVAPPPTAHPGPAAPPVADCQDDCSRRWEACHAKSDADDPKGDGCVKAYKTCMRACFK